ncbi:MAG: serpin family protein [Thermoanaerobaculia bacterium]
MNRLLLILILIFLFLLGMSKNPPKKERDMGANLSSLNRFTFNLYKEILKNNLGENIFFSGTSIYLAMGMVYEGSRGKTLKEMEKVLFIDTSDTKRELKIKFLMEEISKEKENKFHIANALWLQKDFQILKDYLKKIEEYYKGKAEKLNFKENPEGCRKIINSWIEENTSKRIKDLIPEGTLGPSIRMVLTNAIYFKGNWLKKFDEKETREEDFKIDDQKRAKVKMMRALEEEFNYGENENFQVLELPYSGENLSMILILPKKGDLNLDYETFEELRQSLNKMKVDVYIPRFSFEKKYFLNDAFKNMGMVEVFTDSADLSGISGKKNLKVDDIIHQAFVQVDEEGTEAAGATAVTVRVTSVSGKRIPVFRADHPFLFCIYHRKTEVILFLGNFSKPM